nr:chaperone modulator CbpM [uncultured Lichenicoccus sp.]
MITIETLCIEVRGLTREDVERWIERSWVRPRGGSGRYEFGDIDVARVRLILELREELRVDEETLPVVLSLLDQLYEERRRLRRVRDLLDQVGPEQRAALLQLIGDTGD